MELQGKEVGFTKFQSFFPKNGWHLLMNNEPVLSKGTRLMKSLRMGGVLIKNIYDVGCGNFAGPNVVANDASALLGKMFFTINVGCNEDMTVLYIIREAVRDVCGEIPDATKELVLVVPMDVQVYITKLTAEDAVYDQEEAPEWANTNVRQDIMWWAHESAAPHPRQETTVGGGNQSYGGLSVLKAQSIITETVCIA